MEIKEEILQRLRGINDQLPELIKKAEDNLGTLNKELAEIDKSDARENVPYQSKLEEVAQANTRLRRLSARHKAWVDFSTHLTESENIQLGSGILLTNKTRGAEHFFILVQKELADAQHGALSDTTPVGRAIKGRVKGESVEVETPSGPLTYYIREVY